jgi:hypothetical protein
MVGDALSDFFLDRPRQLDDPLADLAWLREHHPVHRHEPTRQWFVFPYKEFASCWPIGGSAPIAWPVSWTPRRQRFETSCGRSSPISRTGF